MCLVRHAVSEPFRIICNEAALSLETSISQDLFVISATPMAMFSPCWRASLEAISSASQVDLAIRSCLLDRHWTTLPPLFWLEVIPWYHDRQLVLADSSPLLVQRRHLLEPTICAWSVEVLKHRSAYPRVWCRYWQMCLTRTKQVSGPCVIRLAALLVAHAISGLVFNAI